MWFSGTFLNFTLKLCHYCFVIQVSQNNLRFLLKWTNVLGQNGKNVINNRKYIPCPKEIKLLLTCPLDITPLWATWDASKSIAMDNNRFVGLLSITLDNSRFGYCQRLQCFNGTAREFYCCPLMTTRGWIFDNYPSIWPCEPFKA